MKIALYFKDIRLGELTFLNGEFVYNSNLEGESRAKVFPSMLLYGLENSVNKKSQTLFKVFDDIKNNIKERYDILKDIDYSIQDNDFIVLAKYGKKKQSDYGFHLITEE